MGILNIKDGQGGDKYLEYSGDGSEVNPFKAKSSIRDSFGNTMQVGSFGAAKVIIPTKRIAEFFTNTLNTDTRFNVTETGTGTVESQFNGSLLKLSTNGIGSSSVETKDLLVYQTGEDIECYFTFGVSAVPTAGSKALIGLFDNDSGVYIGHNGTNWIIGYRNIAVGIDVTQIINATPYNDFRNLHRIRVRFGYLGIGNILFEVKPEGKEAEWAELGIFETDGALQDRTHIGNPTLPIRAEVESTGQDFYLYSGSWRADTWGLPDSIQSIPFTDYGSADVDTNAGEELPFIGYRNPQTFDGYNNKKTSTLTNLEIATSSEGLYSFKIFKVPLGFIAGGFTPIDTFSPLERTTTFTGITITPPADESGISQISNGTTTLNIKPKFATFLAVASSGTGVNKLRLDFSIIGLKARPNEEYLVTKECLLAGAGSDITAWTLNYKDE